ncbi:glycosyltransferase involved in cell wall biosynthesis [Saccharomonospora amisosensis]|uniref:Glycosyltransferase involved in cell wall biosynthesis n=1 Tax=Saccharomonospora amisosensis TaxID=1128677 RepID=A0A7X5UQV3_9PSEU|nr:glycosyltransferase family 4 protein [Saccharomonospora amisosensis]NIJ12059.1 glycosyltransferase involved in cell wall biosynthesis [Saccharomonospora amisosensis]
MSQLEIAMVAPPWFELPPKAYGGIESMCADLVEQLTFRDLSVTLVGVGRNGTPADFIPTCEQPNEDRLGQAMPEIIHASLLPEIVQKLEPDLVHDHSLAGPLLASGRSLPTVVTAHGPVTGEMGQYYRGLGDSVHLVAVSDAQRRMAPNLNWVGTVHNAVRVERFPFQENKSDFALFLGRTCPEKGIPHAIAAAREAGVKLVIAAKCREPDELKYFEREVKPLLGPDVEWIGEVERAQKVELLSAARCLLFPVCWEEPFGIVMVEAMACGTPVIALGRGAIPEVVTHGKTGFVCDEPGELADAIHRASRLSAEDCREEAEDRFDVETMAKRYERVYRAVA